MKRVNQMRFYHLGKISSIRQVWAGQSYDDFANLATSPAIQLEAFVTNEEYAKTLPHALEKAKALYEALESVFKSKRQLQEMDVIEIDLQLGRFEVSLDDDLHRLHTYMVDQVGAYSFDRLVGSADTIFPEALRKVVIPEQVCSDFRSAGRCLAFDLPTSCGFHAFRATDAMLRVYCNHFGATPSGGSRDWGAHIRELRSVLKGGAPKKPNERTVELIDSIRAQDRNPLVHPELNLDLLIFDLCKNAVGLMATDIKNSP